MIEPPYEGFCAGRFWMWYPEKRLLKRIVRKSIEQEIIDNNVFLRGLMITSPKTGLKIIFKYGSAIQIPGKERTYFFYNKHLDLNAALEIKEII